MAHFYVCMDKQIAVSSLPDHFDSSNMTLIDVANYLRKVGLKVNDVRMKLNINQIIHFLERQSSEEERCVKKREIKQIKYQQKNKDNHFNTEIHENDKQNICISQEYQNLDSMARSYIEQFTSEPSFKISNRKFEQLIQNLQPRLVQTKNMLDQPQKRNGKVTFKIHDESIMQETDLLIERLERQNHQLQKCLQNIFTFFQGKKLFERGTVKNISRERYGQLSAQLSNKFSQFQQNYQSRIAIQAAKSQLLQQKLSSLSNSISAFQENTSILNKLKFTQKQVQTNTSQKLQRIEQQYLQLAEQVKQYETLIFLKDQQLASMKMINSDLKIQLQTLKKPERPKSKSYKKFFEMTGENLSKTVTF